MIGLQEPLEPLIAAFLLQRPGYSGASVLPVFGPLLVVASPIRFEMLGYLVTIVLITAADVHKPRVRTKPVELGL